MSEKVKGLIAEIGQAHEGSLGLAHSYIDALAETGVETVKFQVHIAHAESSADEPFRINFSYEDQTRYDYWKRMEFTESQWAELKRHCEEKGMEFLATPFSNEAVNLLERLGVRRYKIGSGDVSNFLMLEKIARTGKPILLSSGMSAWEELDRAVSFVQSFGNELCVMQCTTAYPTKPAQWGLNIIPEMKRRYGVPVGFSDHSGDIFAGLAATTVGAEMLEFHVVFHKKMFGPDTPASLTMEQVKRLAEGVQAIRTALMTPVDKSDVSGYRLLKQIFEKSLAVNKDLPVGHAITFHDLEAKKPSGLGIPASSFRVVIGRKLKNVKKAWDFLHEQDLE